MKRNIFISIMAFAMIPLLLESQTSVQRLQLSHTGIVGISYEYWKAKNDQISEFAFPLTFLCPVNDRIGFYAVTAPAMSNLSVGENYSLKGMSDLKFGGHWLTLKDRFLFTFGLNLPTGRSALQDDEYPVASVLSMPAFNFRVPSFGQGLDFQLGVNGAFEVGGFVIGCGASYLMKGGYKPFQDLDQTYKPGDEIAVTTGADKEVSLFGMNTRLIGNFLYSMYLEDTWAGKNLFQSGNRLLIQFSSLIKLDALDLTMLIRDQIKDKNKIGSGEIFDTERNNTNGNQLEILGYGYFRLKQTLKLKGIAEYKLYSKNDYGAGGAALLGLGAGVQKYLSSRMACSMECRYYFGSIYSSTGNTSTVGMKLSGGLEYTI